MAQNLKVSQPYANAFIQMVSGKDSLDKVISDLTYIEAMTNVKQVKLDIKVDKTLIGGFTVQIGSRVIDTSIQGQLKKLASHLGASSPL